MVTRYRHQVLSRLQSLIDPALPHRRGHVNCVTAGQRLRDLESGDWDDGCGHYRPSPTSEWRALNRVTDTGQRDLSQESRVQRSSFR